MKERLRKSMIIPAGNVYLMLAQMTSNRRLRMVYAKAYARQYRKKAAVGAAFTKERTAILPQR